MSRHGTRQTVAKQVQSEPNSSPASCPTFQFRGTWLSSDIFDLLLARKLTPTDVIVYALIDAYTYSGSRGCFATNAYIANSAGVCPLRVSCTITKLVGLGLVERTGSTKDRILRVVRSESKAAPVPTELKAGTKSKPDSIRAVYRVRPKPKIDSIRAAYRVDSMSENGVIGAPFVSTSHRVETEKSENKDISLHSTDRVEPLLTHRVEGDYIRAAYTIRKQEENKTKTIARSLRDRCDGVLVGSNLIPSTPSQKNIPNPSVETASPSDSGHDLESGEEGTLAAKCDTVPSRQQKSPKIGKVPTQAPEMLEGTSGAISKPITSRQKQELLPAHQFDSDPVDLLLISPVIPTKAERAAAILRQAVTVRGVGRSKWIPSQWASDFEKLATDLEGEWSRINAVLEWYVQNMDGDYAHEAYSARSFRAKFFSIEKAMQRSQKREQPLTDPIEAKSDPREEEVLKVVGREFWPKGSERGLLSAIRKSLRNFDDFFQKCERAKLSQDTRRFLGRIYARVGSPEIAIKNWFREVHRRVKRWSDWSGDLSMFVWSSKQKDVFGWICGHFQEPACTREWAELLSAG